ncbi:hypothetical protein C8R44DRAFT_602380 [Mycena epipterygia]|nr:hypothetical protein C8R44DRAFT_602380 [Mycena epipterygia]
MRPHILQFACETVAEEMETRRKNSVLQGIGVVTPEFIDAWNLDEEDDMTPFLTQILETAAQTDHAKLHNKKKKPEKMCQVVTRQLLYQSSNRCLAFQAEFGLFLWSTGCSRATIDALFRCGLSVCYDSVLNLIESLADHCMLECIKIILHPHSFNYDNLNLSTSIFVEQRGAAGPAKVQSGTFAIFYRLRNASLDHMLIGPIMKRFKAFGKSKGLQFNLDIKPSLDHLRSCHEQLLIVVIHCLFKHNEGFEEVAKHASLKHTVRRAIPVGYTTDQVPSRATTIEEATVRGNLLFHDDVYIHQLGRTSESLSKYAIPDVNAWTRREIFQLGFGLFHLCLNLVWAVLHVHRGGVNEVGSLSYFFALMEKARLGNDQPDYHSLLAALTQVLDGLLLNAWMTECGHDSLKSFAASKPTPEQLRELAAHILTDYATPMSTTSSSEPEDPDSDDASSDSSTDSEFEQPPASKSSRTKPVDPKEDVAHHNIRLLIRDLLVVAAVVRAISDGDIGRVEVFFPHLMMMFRGAGCNKYCTEILHFLLNLKYIWTPEFA